MTSDGTIQDGQYKKGFQREKMLYLRWYEIESDVEQRWPGAVDQRAEICANSHLRQNAIVAEKNATGERKGEQGEGMKTV